MAKLIWKTEKRNVKDLKVWEENPRTIDESSFKDLKDSVDQDGDWGVLVIDTDGTVISGNQRLKAIEGKVDVKVPNRPLTDKERKRIALRANRTKGKDNFDILANWSKESLLEGWFSEKDLDKLLNIEEDNFDAQAEYDAIVQPEAVLGDLWALGEHRLLCGDSTKQEDFEKLMGGVKADMIFTDPPYNVTYDYWGFRGTRKKGVTSKKVFNDSKDDESFSNFINAVFLNCFNNTIDGANFYCWHASRNESLFRIGIQDAGWKISQNVIWLKPSHTFSPGQDYHRMYEPCYFGWKDGKKHYVNRSYGTWNELILLDYDNFEEMMDVFYQKRDNTSQYIHPTQKPIRLAERAIKYHCPNNGVVIEPFNGSGSTMMACEQLKRKCYSIELDPKFVDVAIKRWEDFTGKKAQKVI